MFTQFKRLQVVKLSNPEIGTFETKVILVSENHKSLAFDLLGKIIPMREEGGVFMLPFLAINQDDDGTLTDLFGNTWTVQNDDLSGLQKAISERGYVVFIAYGTPNLDYRPGDVVDPSMNNNPVGQPFSVICETDLADFIEHRKAAGFDEPMNTPPPDARYWRATTD